MYIIREKKRYLKRFHQHNYFEPAYGPRCGVGEGVFP